MNIGGKVEGTLPLAQALQRLTRIPSMRHKYGRYLGLGRRPRLVDLPPLTRDELSEAVDAMMREAPDELSRASLHLMGGTTSTSRMGALPADLHVDEISPHLRPFAPGDLLASLSTPFHMRASHDLHNALAARAGIPTLSLDAPTDQMIEPCLDLFEQHGVTALATTLDTVQRILRFCAASGRNLDFLRKVLWSGPAMDAQTRSLIRTYFPHLRTWTLFGSAETWIIGHSGPDCAVDTFHPLPYQHTEIVSGRMLVTVTHRKSVVPLLRYDTGTGAEWTSCPCDLPGRALRTHSRIDTPYGPLSRLVEPSDLASLALQLDSVEAAQVVLISPHTKDERLRLRVRLRPGTEADLYTVEWIRHHVVSGCLALAEVIEESPETFEVTVSRRLLDQSSDGSAPATVVRTASRDRCSA
ncbi:AMP-dependent synthetase [Nocardiopsis sp. CT-R113]|uniref:AMP-dependent synthetase n=1 Tax=Nocardiopsis codii TaxID=3065942 RepID=A0ABU7K378_9ACTN|nr:AMP-dependent synthetase [Nocardiopsis sp. CT-R113]MEE2036654.1 AMP-dependent synthetase [Nocardiopsis sp. CT-R113]